MRTFPSASRPALVALALVLFAGAARAADSTSVDSPPAPLIRTPVVAPAPAPVTAPGARPAPMDTAQENRRRTAIEDYSLGRALEQQGAYSAAIVSYYNAAKKDGTLRGPSYRIGMLFKSRQQYRSAAQSFREELRRDPGSVPARMEYALALCELDDTTRARRMLRELVRTAPQDAEVWRSLGFVEGRMGDLAAAERALRGSLGLREAHAGTWRDLGVVLVAAGRVREARDAYRRSLALAPGAPPTLINLANLEARANDHAAALALYERAERADSTLGDAYRGQVRALVSLGREGDAGAVWLRWVAATDAPEVREGAARHFLRQGRTDAALRVARDAVRAKPRSGEAWWLLGEMHAEADEVRDAVTAYRRAEGLFSDAADRARVERSLTALRAAAPDSLRTFLRADSVSAAAADTVRRVPSAPR